MNSRGFSGFLIGQLAILFFALLLTLAFFGVFNTQLGFFGIASSAGIAQDISRMIDSAYSSKAQVSAPLSIPNTLNSLPYSVSVSDGFVRVNSSSGIASARYFGLARPVNFSSSQPLAISNQGGIAVIS